MPSVLGAGLQRRAQPALQGMGFQVDVQGDDIEQALGRGEAPRTPKPDDPLQPGQTVRSNAQLF